MTSNSSVTAPAPQTVHNHAATVELVTFGFWVYILSDLVIFSMLFSTYAVLGRNYAGGPTPRDLFDLRYTFFETAILLTSSMTCGMAMLAVYDERRTRVLFWFAVTFLLGLAFVVMEIREFHVLVIGGNGPSRSAFLSAYFTLVGTHGLHVTAGLVWIAVMMWQVTAKGLSWTVGSRFVRLSMFWHFLDIVWVGVFTVVYLMGKVV